MVYLFIIFIYYYNPEVADIFYSQYEDFDKSSDSDEEFCEFLKDILDKEEDEGM